MHALAEKLLKAIRKQELVRAGDRVAVAVSGGADSVAVLLLLVELRPELGIVLSVVHVNHKLRGQESDEDEQFVAELAARFELEFLVRAAPVERRSGAGIESAARRLRYEFFRSLAEEGRATKIATGHTLDDQAETVLLRMFRGTGIRGLAGIHPRLRLSVPSTQYPVTSDQYPVASDRGRVPAIWHEALRASHPNLAGKPLSTGYWVPGTGCEVVRPLLGFRRAELREYLRARRQKWREDSSNEDLAFLRNRVRQRLLPAIVEEFGEAAIEHLAELAEIARAEEEWAVESVLRSQFSVLSDSNREGSWPRNLGDTTSKAQGKEPRQQVPSELSETGAALDVERLLALPLAAARRVVRAWIHANAPEVSISFRLIEEILDLARGAAGKRMELPRRADAGKRSGTEGARVRSVRRGRKQLVLEAAACSEAGGYAYELSVPGEVAAAELRARIEARVVNAESVPEAERDRLLDPERLAGKVLIRNWRAGDRFWPAHTSAEKKVKELLANRHVTGIEKKLWPVAVAAGELVWMRGFAAPEKWRAREGKGIWIREIAAMM